MSIIKSIYKIFNGESWDEHYLKTSSDQVVHTKSDGTATTVQSELAELNSNCLTAIPTQLLAAKNSVGTYGLLDSIKNYKLIEVVLLCGETQFVSTRYYRPNTLIAYPSIIISEMINASTYYSSRIYISEKSCNISAINGAAMYVAINGIK